MTLARHRCPASPSRWSRARSTTRCRAWTCAASSGSRRGGPVDVPVVVEDPVVFRDVFGADPVRRPHRRRRRRARAHLGPAVEAFFANGGAPGLGRAGGQDRRRGRGDQQVRRAGRAGARRRPADAVAAGGLRRWPPGRRAHGPTVCRRGATLDVTSLIATASPPVGSSSTTASTSSRGDLSGSARRRPRSGRVATGVGAATATDKR